MAARPSRRTLSDRIVTQPAVPMPTPAAWACFFERPSFSQEVRIEPAVNGPRVCRTGLRGSSARGWPFFGHSLNHSGSIDRSGGHRPSRRCDRVIPGRAPTRVLSQVGDRWGRGAVQRFPRKETGTGFEWHSDQARDPGRRQNGDWARGGKKRLRCGLSVFAPVPVPLLPNAGRRAANSGVRFCWHGGRAGSHRTYGALTSCHERRRNPTTVQPLTIPIR